MTKETILKKAIEKAVANGFKLKGYSRLEATHRKNRDDYVFMAETPFDENKFVLEYISLENVIFDHDFAKAFWGQNYVEVLECGHTGHEGFGMEHNCEDFEAGGLFFSHTGVAWREHLKQMVLEENPLDYLAKFLN